MPLARIAWLISLILMATTLPASACSGLVLPGQADSETAGPEISAPTQNSDTDEDSPKAMQIVPSTDVWDGVSTRSTNTGSSRLLVASLLGNDPGTRCVPAEAYGFIHIQAPRIGGRVQRAWLACRYAHAPPFCP